MAWDEARAHAAPIRFAVFVEEQGVPREIELDEMDAQCVHALAFDGATRGRPPAACCPTATSAAWRC